MNLTISECLSQSKFFYELGFAHWRNGQNDLAVSCLDECVRMGHPYFKVAALVNLEFWLSRMGDHDRMMLYHRRIAELPEEESKFVPRVVLGRTLTALGEYDRAADTYQRALRMKKRDAALVLDLVELELIRHQYDSAAELLATLPDARDAKVGLMAAALAFFLAALQGWHQEIYLRLEKVLALLSKHGVPADLRWDFTKLSPALKRITHPDLSYLVGRVVAVLNREVNVQDFLNKVPPSPLGRRPRTLRI